MENGSPRLVDPRRVKAGIDAAKRYGLRAGVTPAKCDNLSIRAAKVNYSSVRVPICDFERRR
jgi:hypothetical protein